LSTTEDSITAEGLRAAKEVAGHPTRRLGLARRAMLVALVSFAVWTIVGNWDAVAAALNELSAWAVLVAFVPAMAAMAASLFVWRALMSDLGHRLAVPAASRIFYVSQLGKYVPGSVWSILTQIELSREHNIPKKSNITVGVLAIAVAITTGLSVAALMLPFAGAQTMRHYWWILLIIPMLLAGLHPRVLGYSLNLVLRLVRREPMTRTPSWAGLGRVAALQVVVWFALGLQAWVLLIGLGADPWRTLPAAIGGYALAYSLGLLAIGLPAGAGVREAALTLALSTVVAAPAAFVVALLSRAVLTVVDLALAGSQYALIRRMRAKRRAPA
jgi:uncharacterized membrane protein YbhN (UPF0104 family)